MIDVIRLEMEKRMHIDYSAPSNLSARSVIVLLDERDDLAAQVTELRKTEQLLRELVRAIGQVAVNAPDDVINSFKDASDYLNHRKP